MTVFATTDNCIVVPGVDNFNTHATVTITHHITMTDCGCMHRCACMPFSVFPCNSFPASCCQNYAHTATATGENEQHVRKAMATAQLHLVATCSSHEQNVRTVTATAQLPLVATCQVLLTCPSSESPSENIGSLLCGLRTPRDLVECSDRLRLQSVRLQLGRRGLRLRLRASTSLWPSPLRSEQPSGWTGAKWPSSLRSEQPSAPWWLRALMWLRPLCAPGRW